MSWAVLVIFMISTSIGECINRPVYKIVLAQKGYAQFIQYDVETPPLREFTFCTWIRVYDLSGDQTIFTYVANGNNRVVRLWLDSGGQQMKISINGKVTSSSQVDIVKDVWRHVCLSYQADYGVWALYIDARLVTCEAAQSLYGYVLPGGGSVIIGYGTADNGASNGFEGEIFGANMILTSTIERNFTAKSDPHFEQKRFERNKLKERNKSFQYIVLSDLETDEIHNNFEKTQIPLESNTNRSYIKLRTPHSFIEHDVGIELTTNSIFDASSIEREVLRFTYGDRGKSAENDKVNFWNILNSNDNGNTYKIQTRNKSANPNNYNTPSEFETPPPLGTSNQIYAEEKLKQTLRTQKPMNVNEVKENVSKQIPTKKLAEEIFEYETPPPVEKNTKVYGQWTSSKFAGNVLNYLKTINFNNREQRKIPPTIQLTKLSDSYPYASEFRVNKIRPSNQFQRRNFMEKRIELNKKDKPQVNVQILEDDFRSNILRSHAQTKPKNVEVTNRGEHKRHRNEKRFYRNVDSQESVENLDESIFNHKIPELYTSPPAILKKQSISDLTLQSKNLIAILPFLKSLEYFIEDSQNSETKPEVRQDNNMYTKKFSNANKWHNVKSYSNDYTPRKIKLDSNNGQTVVDDKIAEANKRHPAIRLKYKHEERKFVQSNGQEEDLLKGRKLAMEVSNHSNYNTDSVSILKYNHGFLPGHNIKPKIPDKLNPVIQGNTKQNKIIKNSFNKHVKIGNALNERHVIGQSIKQKQQRFVGDETIPDINKYSSDIDNVRNTVPPSLGPRICRNVELYDRVLYVQPDESIDMTHILSPVRAKNIGIEFILQNYKKCSLTESSLESNVMLFINWSKTPVRLFGGAYPKKTTDLCGFFK